MADEKKVLKSIRANPTAFDRLAAIAKEGGLDQGAALEALLNTWDVQAAKGMVPERAADVADFDAHVQGIQAAFLRSLELAQSAESRARVSYQAQLDAMSATIARLQAELEEERKRYAALSEVAHAATEGRKRMEERVMELEKGRKLEALLESLADKLDAPTLPESKPKRGRKAKAETEPEPGVALTEPIE
ncbi:MAG: hypothetical protein IJQ81_09210 [Oscillibacter sp.]|nr:hypothetical protein [Oscillibacter sp.]